jgi:hypothetical protein
LNSAKFIAPSKTFLSAPSPKSVSTVSPSHTAATETHLSASSDILKEKHISEAIEFVALATFK